MSASNDEFLLRGRRAFLASGVGLILSGSVAFAAGARDPLATIQAIYRLAVRGKGPSWIDKGDRPRDLSTSLVALWAKTDLKLVAGDEGPVDFDLVADTNGLTLTGFSAKTEKQTADAATVAVTLAYKEKNPRPEPLVVRYDLVREGGQWKIDEIRSSNWSARGMLNDFLK
jgi:hypothetical protein